MPSFILRSARSTCGSLPITVALNVLPVESFTYILVAPFMTWLLVIMYPFLLIITPEPKLSSVYVACGALLKKFLKKLPKGLGCVPNGIISAKGRAIGGPYEDFIQTNAAINPGNSGGPLINMKGQVIGINTAIIKGAQGIGFSIPVNVVKEVLPELETGKITRGWLGIEIQEITPSLKKAFNLQTTRGALVSSVVPGGPAAKAGLRSGEVIIKYNGIKVKEMSQLPWLVGNTKPGATVPVEVIRNGKKIVLSITVGNWNSKSNVF